VLIKKKIKKKFNQFNKCKFKLPFKFKKKTKSWKFYFKRYVPLQKKVKFYISMFSNQDFNSIHQTPMLRPNSACQELFHFYCLRSDFSDYFKKIKLLLWFKLKKKKNFFVKKKKKKNYLFNQSD